MIPDTLLPTIAQVSVTLAALSGVAGVIRPTGAETHEPVSARFFLREVAILGLAATLLSLLPLVFDDSWRVLSAVGAGFWVAMFIFGARRLQLQQLSLLRRAWPGPAITLVGLALFIWNIVVPSEQSPMRYAAGVLCLLTISAMCFVFALFGRPPE